MAINASSRLAIESFVFLELRLHDVAKRSRQCRVKQHLRVSAFQKKSGQPLLMLGESTRNAWPTELRSAVQVQTRFYAAGARQFCGALGILHENHRAYRRHCPQQANLQDLVGGKRVKA